MIIASEDRLIQAIIKRILKDLGFNMADLTPICAGGGSKLRAKVPSLVRSARGGVSVIMCTDLDFTSCLVRMRDEWFPKGIPSNMVFSIAIREADAWILADPGISGYLASPASVPESPENVQDPKSALIEIAKRSRKREIRDEMVIKKGALAKVGPGYNDLLESFVKSHWNVGLASRKSKSLKRLIDRISNLAISSRVAGSG